MKILPGRDSSGKSLRILSSSPSSKSRVNLQGSCLEFMALRVIQLYGKFQNTGKNGLGNIQVGASRDGKKGWRKTCHQLSRRNINALLRLDRSCPGLYSQ
jgi:hypothetical protein